MAYFKMIAGNLIVVVLIVVVGGVLANNCGSGIQGTLTSAVVQLPPLVLRAQQAKWHVHVQSKLACQVTYNSRPVGLNVQVCESGSWPAPGVQVSSAVDVHVTRYGTPPQEANVYTTVYCNEYDSAVVVSSSKPLLVQDEAVPSAGQLSEAHRAPAAITVPLRDFQ